MPTTQSLSKVSSGFVEKTEENAEETYQKEKMNDGYPVTMTPYVPEIMKHAIVQKKISSGKRIAIGLTFSSETSKLVSIQYLEMIRQQLLRIFVNHPVVMKELEKPIPSNTIAVSFSEANFQLGETCQDFIPVDKFKVPKNAFFTYQKLSENLQATFYNENGIQFLAGLCYYPEPYGKQVYLKNDEASVILVRAASEPYPLQDREKMHKKITYKRYGRDCGTAGKRVFVECGGKYGVIRHVEYNHFTDKWTYTNPKFRGGSYHFDAHCTPCDECLKDAFTYKWETPKKGWRKSIGRVFSTLKDAFACKVEEPKKEGLKATILSAPSKATVTDSALLSAPSEKKQEAEQLNLTTMIKFLEIVGIQAPKIIMLSNLPNDVRIPMKNKITKETLPEFKCPHVNDLTAFMMANSDLRIDFSSLKEGTDNECEKDSEVTVALDSLTLSRTTTNLDAPTSSAFSEIPSSASSTENLLEDFDKVEDATERDNEFDDKIVN